MVDFGQICLYYINNKILHWCQNYSAPVVVWKKIKKISDAVAQSAEI